MGCALVCPLNPLEVTQENCTLRASTASENCVRMNKGAFLHELCKILADRYVRVTESGTL